jgi:hypothetical protein
MLGKLIEDKENGLKLIIKKLSEKQKLEKEALILIDKE